MSCNAPGCSQQAYLALYCGCQVRSYACPVGHTWTSQSKPGQLLSELLPITKRPPNPEFWELA